MPARIDPNAPRVCQSCNHEQPADHFYASGTGNGRRRICIRCLRAREFEKATFHRHPRYNARHEVWCNNCKQYLHAEHFKPHPSRPGVYWSYCKACVRIIDRMRYRAAVSTPDGRREVMASRKRRDRRQKSAEYRGRRAFVVKAIEILGRRGFTKSEICKLARVALTQLYKWQQSKNPQRPTPQIEARFAELLVATSHMPIGDEPAFRRRLAHPELALILARTAGMEQRHPVRNRWKTFAEITDLPDQTREDVAA